MAYVNIINVDYESAWRNWQTHMTQNHAGNREGSIPSAGTIYQNAETLTVENTDFQRLAFFVFKAWTP